MQSNRLISLDVLRGLTVMFMIFVNNGAGEEIFSTLQHSKWNGMTPCDLVFPFFLFIMGFSTYLSLRKTDFRWSAALGRKILKRTVLLFLIGLAINWLDLAFDGRPLDFAHLRIMAVMQRIALCYCLTALLAIASASMVRAARGSSPSGTAGLSSQHSLFSALSGVVIAILIIYSGMLLIGGGYNYDPATNILAQVDLSVMGYDHLYHRGPVDPEGLLGTFPAACNTLIGFLVAHYALDKRKTLTEKTLTFMLWGAALVLAGYLLSFALPLNKRIWSPSYVLVTCGFASLLQGLLVYVLDLRPQAKAAIPQAKAATPQAKAATPQAKAATPQAKTSPALAITVVRPSAWTRLPLVFGTNPLFLYVASEVIAIVIGYTGIKEACFAGIHAVVTNGYWASVVFAALYVALHGALGYPLWKRHIFIKL